MQTKPLKVKIEFTVEIDMAAWVMNYGTPNSPVVVRADVREYARNEVIEQLRHVGVLAEGQ